MLNLIEHFWQFQVKDCKIVPTVIKLKKEKPKAYFYSEKQSRVLRKKDHSTQAALDVLQVKSKPNQQFLLFEIAENKTVESSLILESQLPQLLNNNSRNLVFFSLQSDFIAFQLILCTLRSKNSTFQAKILAQKQMKDGPWRIGTHELENQIKDNLKNYTIKVVQRMIQKMKIKDHLQKFDLIAATDAQFTNVRCLWCSKLSWAKANFYQINFELMSSNEAHLWKELKQLKPINNFPQKKPYQCEEKLEEMEEETRRGSKQKKQSHERLVEEMIDCRGCEGKAASAGMRQVNNEELIVVRRKHRLSILGIKEDYALVCEQCLLLLDQ